MHNSRWHDPLGSSASGCYSEPDVEMQYGARYSDYEDEDDEAFISFTTTESKCEKLFEQGLGLRLRGEFEQALHCFLDCMKGMQECQYFAKLPQTLRELGGLYNQMGFYEKAVEFAQAEKLFYEAIIVETAKDSGRRPKGRKPRRAFSKQPGSTLANRRGSNPAEYGELLIKKAEEFDKLCHICAQESKFDLALDYCGKAAKIRQSIFGAEHPSTVATLEQFTVLYAEVGRAEYLNALHSTREDDCTDKSAKGDLSDVMVPATSNESEKGTHVSLHDTNGRLQYECDGKHSEQPSGNVTSLTPKETHSPLKDNNIPEPSLSAETAHSLEETGPSFNDTENSKQETVSHTHSKENSCVQTIAFEGQGRGSASECNLLQPSSALSCNDNNIQGCSINGNDIQGKHGLDSPLSSLHTIHKELNSIKELPGCVVVWQGENRGIEQSRCLPLWVLLLGAFIEMALLAYLLCAQ